MQFQVIMVTDPQTNTPTNTQTNPQTGPITIQYATASLARNIIMMPIRTWTYSAFAFLACCDLLTAA